MPNQYNVRVTGLKEAMENLKVLGPSMTDGMAILIKNFADTKIVTPAKETYVPVVTGNLRSTIMATEPQIHGDRVSVTVGAGGPAAKYALKVHENPRSGRTGGVSPQGKKYYPRPGVPVPFSSVGQWKYLETPAIQAARNSVAWLRAEANAVMAFIQRRMKRV